VTGPAPQKNKRGSRAAPGRNGPSAAPRPADAAIDLGSLPEVTGYMLRRAQLAVFQDFLRAYAGLDVRPGQYSVLTVIERNPGLRQSQLSAALGIKRANLVALLDALEHRGLAKRVPVATDRRSYALYLTDAGMELVQKLREINVAHERRVTARIGEAGRRQLLKLLQGVIDAVGEAQAEDDDA
jgi:DNA-binding MarR family transcriptional regulator